jgi:hypothetical protein
VVAVKRETAKGSQERIVKRVKNTVDLHDLRLVDLMELNTVQPCYIKN